MSYNKKFKTFKAMLRLRAARVGHVEFWVRCELIAIHVVDKSAIALGAVFCFDNCLYAVDNMCDYMEENYLHVGLRRIRIKGGKND